MAEPSMIAPPMPAFGWVEDLLPPLGFALAEKFTSALTALPPIDITLPAFSQIDIMPTAFTLMDSPPPVTFSPYKGSVYPFESEMNIASPLRDPAKDAYEGLLERIRNLPAKLDNDHEVGIWFTSAELNVVIHIEAISYTSPSLISFHGRTNDKEMREIELVRHFSQLDVALMAVPKQQPKANRMGFTADRE